MEGALREVVRAALAEAAAKGLPGQHHFYVTFRTDHPGVELAASLRQRYPAEMTIVLQYQFWGLQVGAELFEVTLSFDGKHERLVIPFAAISAFVDPSVQFGLQFPGREAAASAPATTALTVPAETSPTAPAADPGAASDAGERVVALDKFRKK